LVRATNDGITAMVDPQGKVQSQLPRYYQGSLRKTVSLTNLSTPYKQWGFLGIGIILLISLVFIAVIWLKNHQLNLN